MIDSEDELDLSTSFFMYSSEDDDHDHLDRPEHCSKPLYNGAPSDLTEYIMNVLLFQYSVKHSLTAIALNDLLHLLTVILPSDAAVPKSVQYLKQYFERIYAEQKPNSQQFCYQCHQLLKKSESCECDAGISQFITIPIGPQLKVRLESTYVSLCSLGCLHDCVSVNLL